LYKKNRPFNPDRLYALLNNNFLLDIVNTEDEAGHLHDHGHGQEHEEDEAEKEGEEEDEETESAYEARLAEIKENFKKEREEAAERKD
jgi:hypothetical protein